MYLQLARNSPANLNGDYARDNLLLVICSASTEYRANRDNSYLTRVTAPANPFQREKNVNIQARCLNEAAIVVSHMKMRPSVQWGELSASSALENPIMLRARATMRQHAISSRARFLPPLDRADANKFAKHLVDISHLARPFYSK